MSDMVRYVLSGEEVDKCETRLTQTVPNYVKVPHQECRRRAPAEVSTQGGLNSGRVGARESPRCIDAPQVG